MQYLGACIGAITCTDRLMSLLHAGDTINISCQFYSKKVCKCMHQMSTDVRGDTVPLTKANFENASEDG